MPSTAGVLGVAMLDIFGLPRSVRGQLKVKVSLRLEDFGRGGLKSAGGGFEAGAAGHIVEVPVFLDDLDGAQHIVGGGSQGRQRFRGGHEALVEHGEGLQIAFTLPRPIVVAGTA
jgi:hypothetical protein